jgi:uncharacterized phiE125 gp8 family phage protein
MFLREHIPYSVPTADIANWKRTSGGEVLPVSLEEVKVFTARPVQDSAWDDEITTFIRVAQAEIEKETRICLTPGIWTGTLPRFADRIRLTRRPFVSLETFQYVDPSTGTITTVDPKTYHVQDETQLIGMIYRGDANSWPPVAMRRDAVRVSVKAGYAITAEDITAGYPKLPYEMKHAVLMTIASLEKARGDTEASSGNVTVYAMKNSKGGGLVPAEAKSLISQYKYQHLTFC